MKNQIITIEKTSKIYKGATAIGVCMIIGGIMTMASSIGEVLVMLGVILCIYSSIGAWWNNG